MSEPLPAAGQEIAGVLFDFAGTLLVPRPPRDLLAAALGGLEVEVPGGELDALAEAYSAAGIPGAPYPQAIPEELADVYEHRDLSSENHRRAYVGLFQAIESPGVALPALPEAVYAEILEPEGWVAYADAVAVVGEIAARGIRVGLVSNVGFDIRPILRHHGLGQLADRCTLSFEVGHMKPDPRIFQAALRELGTPAAATLMVGDHERADGGARALGMRTLILPMTEPGSVHGLEAVTRVLEGEGRDRG